ncbi:MAG: ABC transporter ATP-binding protein [Defluviitaleaceae bacterium]|nr:ABC transporter ATP-binding protein [Defluviitaleaceae bacterium]
MLKLLNIHAGYDGMDALHNISFELPRGKNLAIVGPNGCGKSTLLKVISGLMPHRGEVYIDDENTADMKPRNRAVKVALLGQVSPVYFAYSVYDTVMMGRYSHMQGMFGTPSKIDKEIAENCIATVGMWGEREKSINALSGGQLQRVFLARTLAQDPQIVLLDEPTNHLDLKFQLELIDYLKDWASKQNRSIIGVLHDINLAMRLCDNIMLMKAGKVVAMGNITADALEVVYDMDVAGVMRETYETWQTLV